MGNLIIKVAGYILLRSVLFLITIVVTQNLQWEWSNLKTGKDWSMFLWMVLAPVVIEIILLGIPLAYGLDRITTARSKILFYLLFLGLFVIEFLLSNWLYGTQSAIIKVAISILLFVLIFRQRLLYISEHVT